MLWNKPVSNNLYVPRQPEEFSHFIHSLDKHFSQKEHSLGHQMRGRETPMAFRIRLGRESLPLFVAPKPVWGSSTEDRREPGRGGTGELNPDPSRQRAELPTPSSLKPWEVRLGWGGSVTFLLCRPQSQPSSADKGLLYQALALPLAQRILALISGTSQAGWRAGGFGHCPPREGSCPAVLS